MKNIFTLIICCIVTNLAFAAPEISVLEKYQSDTNVQLTMCRMKFKIAQLSNGNPATMTDSENYPQCIKESKAELKASLDNALKTIKKSAAKEALKNYHVAVITALEGINPGENEMKISYAQRQIQLKEKTTLAWERFELEQ